MKLFKNILVYQAADQPCSAALRIAARLSRQMESHVTVVDVRQASQGLWRDILGDDLPSPQSDISDQQDDLNTLADEVGFDAENVHIKVLQGRPIDALINESLAGNHDLILKDTDSASKNLFFGSLDLRLLRIATVPVWLAAPDVPAKTRRILAAIDPHVRGDEIQMNERIIRLASMLARQDAAELFVVSAWHTPAAGSEQQSDEFKRFKAAKDRLRRHAWENVEHALNTSLLSIPSHQVLFENGIPSDKIASVTLNVQPDLLVMGSVAHRGIPGVWIGNTAEEVTRQIECSVLTIKPDDFTFLLPSRLPAS